MARNLLVLTALVLGLAAAPASADVRDHLNADAAGHCPVYGDAEICSGQVPSFDGTELDVDLTKPIGTDGGARGLVVMLHGFSNDKHEWESTSDDGEGADKWHWNSHWFAKQGFYVLTYTARGFRTDAPSRDDQPATPAGSSESQPDGTIRLKSREIEAKDTQWLAAQVAAAFTDIETDRVAVTGGSYGGGESWVLAAQRTWDAPHEQDPSLPVLTLQVAVPKYPWTDLAYALAPNGHGGGPSGTDIYESSTGRPGSPDGAGNPIGTVKASYVAGFFALGAANGTFENGSSTTFGDEGPISVPAWNARALGQGDPYDVAGTEDPVVGQIRRGLTEYRASYYQDRQWAAQAPGQRTAVFAVQGWTDDLFPAVEAFRQFQYLKRLDQNWPVELMLADVGHARAQNRPEDWRAVNLRAQSWFERHIGGSHDQQTIVRSLPTRCAGGSPSELVASTPKGLAAGRITVRFATGGSLNNTSGAQDPNGPASDPVVGPVTDAIGTGSGGPCRAAASPTATGGYTATSAPLPVGRSAIGLGEVRVPYTLLGTTATLNARVFDVAPGGEALLLTRGTYRIDTPAYDAAAGEVRLPLFGNHWDIPAGHRLRLDLVQVDQPFLRPSVVPSQITFQAPRLIVPTREATDLTLAGA
jgi:hypothetical protein